MIILPKEPEEHEEKITKTNSQKYKVKQKYSDSSLRKYIQKKAKHHWQILEEILCTIISIRINI